jgi:hypothetical protein
MIDLDICRYEGSEKIKSFGDEGTVDFTDSGKTNSGRASSGLSEQTLLDSFGTAMQSFATDFRRIGRQEKRFAAPCRLADKISNSLN